MMPGHGFLMHSLPATPRGSAIALIVDDHRLDAKERPAGTARLERVRRPAAA